MRHNRWCIRKNKRKWNLLWSLSDNLRSPIKRINKSLIRKEVVILESFCKFLTELKNLRTKTQAINEIVSLNSLIFQRMLRRPLNKCMGNISLNKESLSSQEHFQYYKYHKRKKYQCQQWKLKKGYVML